MAEGDGRAIRWDEFRDFAPAFPHYGMSFKIQQGRAWFAGLLLCVLTLLACGNVARNGFINYDDPDYVTANPHVQGGLTWANVKWAFTTTRNSNWTPLTWLSHMLDAQLFGLNPHAHHLAGLLWHTANALVLFVLLRRLTGALYPSFVAAAFFAVHPLHVESVAWASERKDVLSTLFLLLTVWAYAAYARAAQPGQPPVEEGAGQPGHSPGSSSSSGPAAPQGSHRSALAYYLLALGLYALGLMTKPMLVTLPFLLLLLDYWPLGRLAAGAGQTRARGIIRLGVEKLPFLVLAAGSSAITLLAQTKSYSMLGGLPLRLRIATAVAGYVKYLGKTVWPSGLAIFYPDPNARYFAPHPGTLYPASDQWPVWQTTAAVLFLAALSALVFLRRRQEPWLMTGWCWYLGMLVPVIGLVQAGVQVTADHYTYVPLIGIFIMGAWSVAEWGQGSDPRRWCVAGATVILLSGCVLAAHRQVGFWRDNRTLFAQALAVTSRNPVAEWMVGAEYAQQGQLGLAQTHFRLALEADPYEVEAHSALGSLFELEGRTELATNEYQTSLRLKPADEFARVHLAGVLKKMGQAKEALAQYAQAARWNPDSVEANYQAGALSLDAGDLDRAGQYLERAVALQPNHADALLCLSDLRAQQGRELDALSALRQVVQLYPTNFELRVNYGSMLWKAGLRPDGLAQYREAARLGPAHPLIHYDLGAALLAQGQLAEAGKELAEALRLRPDYLEAAADLGRCRAAQARFKEAELAFEHAVQLAPTNADLQVELATALLMDGQTNAAKLAFVKTGQLQPQLAGRYLSQGQSLLQRGEFDRALAQLNIAVCLEPNSSPGLSQLAWLLATHPQAEMRNGTRARTLAERAIELDTNNAAAWAALDAACAETGNFPDAERAAEKSKMLALAAGATQTAQAADERLALYRQHQPYHLRQGRVSE